MTSLFSNLCRKMNSVFGGFFQLACFSFDIGVQASVSPTLLIDVRYGFKVFTQNHYHFIYCQKDYIMLVKPFISTVKHRTDIKSNYMNILTSRIKLQQGKMGHTIRFIPQSTDAQSLARDIP